jgi:glycine/D-amino acid oxidase-like deaminating enzyme
VGSEPAGAHYRALSFWHDTWSGSLQPRPPLPGHRDADVAVVGAGYTGLWTAYYLLAAQPGLRVVLLEREIAGFGASGRNGGWCSALFPASWPALARVAGRRAAIRQQRELFATVDEVGRVLHEESIDADWAKGGSISLARSAAQLDRAHAAVAAAREWGFGPQDYRLLGAADARGAAAATGTVGAVATPHCAVVHPARLVRGLADVVERRGAVIYEESPVTSIEPGLVRTPQGHVRAPLVVRATEAFTPGLPGLRRTLAPVVSLMVVTEPLPAPVWQQIGLAERPAFADLRHTVVYGQRTADGRMAFGGRGARYLAGSRLARDLARETRIFGWLRRTVREMFPVLAGASFTHAWGGAVGAARDWWASCGVDRRTGLAWAGGYVGDGVATSNLAGRTLADLLLGRDTELVRLPWVGHRSPPWEPEPLRWVGINAGILAAGLSDAEESRTGRVSVVHAATTRLLRLGR